MLPLNGAHAVMPAPDLTGSRDTPTTIDVLASTADNIPTAGIRVLKT